MNRKFHQVSALHILLCILWGAGSSSGQTVETSPYDLVEVATLDPTIVIDLPYATDDNFTRTKLYPNERCYLRREVAESLVRAHQSLAPVGIGLKIWDGYRPHAVQYKMWEKAPLKGYVGNPDLGSKHNRGAAVDITLVSLITGVELEMPTKFDEFTLRAHRDFPNLKANVLENRKLLQNTMREHGFVTIKNEWWHFDYQDWKKFPLEKIGIDELAQGKRPSLESPRPAAQKNAPQKNPLLKIFRKQKGSD